MTINRNSSRSSLRQHRWNSAVHRGNTSEIPRLG